MLTSGVLGDLMIERDDAVVVVTINRPRRRNAMTLAMYDQLVALCEELSGTASVRVVVLRGAGGRAFCAGTDIGAFGDAGQDVDAALAIEQRSYRAIAAWQLVPQTTVAAVDGVAAGGGFALALASDLRVASSSAKFGFPIAATLSNVLSAEMTQLLVHGVGHSIAQHMLMSAELYPAGRLHDVGFVHQLVQRGELEELGTAPDAEYGVASEYALTWAHRLTQLAPMTQWGSKRVLHAVGDRSAGGSRDEMSAAIVRAAYGSSDFRAAVAAFTRGEPGAGFSRDLPSEAVPGRGA